MSTLEDAEIRRIREEHREGNNLVWFVRYLLLIGNTQSVAERVNSLETLQSMLFETGGEHETLLTAIETVKRSLPGFDAYQAELQSQLPLDTQDLLKRANASGLSHQERAAIQEEAGLQLLRISNRATASDVAEALRRVNDPTLSEEARRIVRAQLFELLVRAKDCEAK